MSTIEFNAQLMELRRLLMTFAYNLTKNAENANDLYQETAYRALKNKNKFKPGTNFKAWMMTIMKNIFINDYRKRVKANTIFDSTDNQYYLNSGSHSVRNEGDSNILMKELNRMIDNLDEGLRVPFLMHHEGHKYQDIADFMELPLGTVKSRIFFARKELKKNIRGQYGEAFG